MYRRHLLLSALFFTLLTTVHSQDLELPRKSPRASVTHTVGMTEVRMEYSSPALRGRKVWGELVPFDQVWRAGANEATAIAFSHDVMIEGQPLAAGRYALFVIPSQEREWVAVFNRQVDQWGAYDYNEQLDVLRVPLRLDTLCTSEERLQYHLTDQGLDQGQVCLRWDNLQTCFTFRVPVLEQIDEDVAQAIGTTDPGRAWLVYAQAADFLGSYDEFSHRALDYAIKSTSRFDNSWNWWLRAELEAKVGDYDNAVRSAQRAISVGSQQPEDRFFQNARATIERKLQEWRSL